MKKLGLIILMLVLFTVIFAGCGCKHEWHDATCTEPKMCVECGEEEGEALGHNWREATCTMPKTCAVCGETDGGALGHEWQAATCEVAKICLTCGETEGKPLGHKVTEWEVVTAATCSEKGEQKGVCTVCGESVTKPISQIAHTPGEWEVEKEPTATADGTRIKKCVVCGKELDKEEFTLSKEELKEQYIAKCVSYSYDEIARNPDNYKLEYAVFKGEVIQVMESGEDYTLRVNITQGKYTWSDTILVSYSKQDSGEARILEDDIVMLYGQLYGTYTYETVMGASLTVPLMFAEYVDIL